VHLVGVAYKPNVGDVRESPALKLIELLQRGGADVSYTDPHVPELRKFGLTAVDVEEPTRSADAVVIVTDHAGIDFERIAKEAKLVVDLRNATGPDTSGDGRVWKL
jgi:UDP-N-acetyl-D-glucosamine dehydrogenase